MEKYKTNVKKASLRLDSDLDSDGKIINLASSVVNENDRLSTIELLKNVTEILNSDEYAKEVKNHALILKKSLIEYYGYFTLLNICNEEKRNLIENDLSLSELLNELNKLIGLEKVKEKVNDLISYQMVRKMRKENRLYSLKNTMHLAFTGNSGTGKTTVARIVGRIYKQIGLLSKGHFVEVSRTDLIAGYQGQTALKVKSVVEKAKGGVLFIDEAYSLTENERSDSYGRECLTELTKALEDYRCDLVVIVAGYTKPMEKFFESNPGLKSRFNTFIEFDDYSADEMKDILNSFCLQNDYMLSDEAKDEIYKYFISEIENKDDSFANGRMVRNLYEDLVMSHAKRVVKIDNPSKDDLRIILVEDFFNIDLQKIK